MNTKQYVESVIALERLEQAEDEFNAVMVEVLIEEGVNVPFDGHDLGDVRDLRRKFRKRIELGIKTGFHNVERGDVKS